MLARSYILAIVSTYSTQNIDLFKYLPSEVVVQRGSVKEVFLEILQNSQENTCARFSFLITFQALNVHKAFRRRPGRLLNVLRTFKTYKFTKKEALAQVLSYEFCKTSKNTFFNRTPQVAASVPSTETHMSRMSRV